MPPRFVTLAIVAVWLAMTGWLAYRDLWPRWTTGAPPYAIDLADEARRQSVPVRWTVHRQTAGQKEEKLGRLHTWVAYHDEDDSFELHGEMNNPQLGPLFGLSVEKVENMYRVGRAGELRELEVKIQARLERLKLQVTLRGEVRDRFFHPECHFQPNLLGQELKLQPVEVSDHGTMLNPMHPVNRIAGLRPGQRWRMPLVDPLAMSLKSAAGLISSTLVLEARVADQPTTLPWHGQEVPCLVIDYQGDQLTARTWVRQSDGLVLRQEATQLREGETLILQRE